MKDTLSGIVSMLETGSPEQRVAAAQVLAWLAPKTPQVVKALGGIAEHGDAFLRPYAVEALGAIGNAASLAALIPFLHIEGPIRGKVVRIYAKAGKSAASVLIKEHAKADPVTRSTIIEILAKIRSDDALQLLLGVLKDPGDPAAAERIHQLLVSEISTLDPNAEEDAKELDRLRRKLTTLFKTLPKRATQECRAWTLDLLARLSEPSMRTLFVAQAGPKQPQAVRRAALQGLRGMELTPAQTSKLLAFLAEDDFLHVVGPTLEVLDGFEAKGAQAASALSKLLESERPEVRLFALRKLGSFQTATSARLLIPFLDSDDPKFREQTAASLEGNPEAAEGVLKRFVAGRDLDEARRPLGAILRLAPLLKPNHVKKLATRLLELVANEDPVQTLYRQVLSKGAPETVEPILLKEAQKLRKAARHSEALMFLQILSETWGGRLEGDARFELAVTSMLQRRKHPEANEGDPVIGHLCHLLASGYKLLDKLKRETALSTEDLYYLGQRFVERLGEERRFGQDLLTWLVQKEPEAKASVQAMQKLKVEGLA
ncbi:MAG: HEAT repeat domain-containing protein [Planctomycetota bacterium]